MTQMTFLPATPADMVEEYAVVTEQEGTGALYIKLIYEEMQEFIESTEPEHDLKELADLVYVLYGYARVKGYKLDEAVARVHKNNMGRMRQPDGTILRREDGKIIKCPEYPQVELGDLV